MDLQSKDSVGPGFGVTGTVTEGITVGSLHDKGPAKDSGKISIGVCFGYVYSVSLCGGFFCDHSLKETYKFDLEFCVQLKC